MKYLLLLGVFSFTLLGIFAQQCNIIYVTTTGAGVGTISDPTDLPTAIAASSVGDVIRVGEGVYSISSALSVKAERRIADTKYNFLNFIKFYTLNFFLL